MTRTFTPPPRVVENMRRRATARRPKVCCLDDCAQIATVARGGHAARCSDCDRRDFTPPPTPDPARTLTALRAAAGLRAEAMNVGRTVLDSRAEDSGRRVSSARRAAARGQVGGHA